MKFFYFLLIIACSTQEIFAVSYKEIKCNRLEREERERKIIINKIDSIKKRILKALKDPNSEKAMNKAKYLREYKSLTYKNRRLKRKSKIFPETLILKGCPLL